VSDTPNYAELRTAIEIVKQHITDEWIIEECAGDEVFGCASCNAIRLRRELDGIQHYLDEDEGKQLASGAH
jgi:hypothetical protein